MDISWTLCGLLLWTTYGCSWDSMRTTSSGLSPSGGEFTEATSMDAPACRTASDITGQSQTPFGHRRTIPGHAGRRRQPLADTIGQPRTSLDSLRHRLDTVGQC